MITYIETTYKNDNGFQVIKTEKTVGQNTTLYVANESEQIMSDVWELVTKAYYWDNGLKTVWLGESSAVTVDADLTTLSAEIENYYYDKFLAEEVSRAQDDADTVAVRDRVVKVVSGKNRADKGKIGKVVFIKEMLYGMGYRSSYRNKLAIALDDEKVSVVKNGRTYENYKNVIWVWAHNTQVVDNKVTSEALQDAASRAKRRAVQRVDQIKNAQANTSASFKKANAVLASS